MSIHSSLKMSSMTAANRSVLKRTERIEKLAATKGFNPEKSPILGMVKTSAKGGVAKK